MDATATEHIKKEITALENRLKTLKAYVEIQEKSEVEWKAGDVFSNGHVTVAIVKEYLKDSYILTGLDGNFGRPWAYPARTRDEMSDNLLSRKYKKIGKLGVVVI